MPDVSGVPSGRKGRRTRPEDNTVLTKPALGARRNRRRAHDAAARKARKASRG